MKQERSLPLVTEIGKKVTQYAFDRAYIAHIAQQVALMIIGGFLVASALIVFAIDRLSTGYSWVIGVADLLALLAGCLLILIPSYNLRTIKRLLLPPQDVEKTEP